MSCAKNISSSTSIHFQLVIWVEFVRLVGVVKRCLKAVLANQTVRDEVLHTVFTKIEFMVNSHHLLFYVVGRSGRLDSSTYIEDNSRKRQRSM